MRQNLLICLGSVLACISSGFLKAQNLDTIGKTSPLRVNGGVSANLIHYAANGALRRDPFNYFLNGNLNLSIYGWSIPISFTYSNRSFNYLQPFNQYGLHPTCQWITGHLGWTAMNFSPYTLGGHLFLGAGVDLAIPRTPLKISAMYGRLQQAVEADTAARFSQPAYRRMGMGLKVSYEKPRYTLGFIFFRAKDALNSLSDNVLYARVRDSMRVFPQENVVLSAVGSVNVLKNLKITGEYATSVLSRDIRSLAVSPVGLGRLLTPLLTNRQSTSVYHAYKLGIGYTIGAFSVGLGLERVDPDYRTLGAYFFANDFQNFTVNFAQVLLRNKVTISGNVGIQRDDLRRQKISQLQRAVMAFNVNLVPSERFNVSASYSNFQSFTFIKQQFDFINQITPYDVDTLRYSQLAQTASLALNYTISKSKTIRHALTSNFSLQTARDSQQENVVSQNQFYNLNLAYNLTNTPLATAITVGVNASSANVPGSVGNIWGPTVALSKKLFKRKVQTRVSVGYNVSRNSGARQTTLLNLRGSAGYTFRKQHNFNLSVVGLLRNNTGQIRANESRGFAEVTTSLGYSYSF